MDVYLSDPLDLSSDDSGTDSEEPSNIGACQAHKAGTSPHHRQSASFMDFLTRLGAPEVCRRVLDVLGYMESLQLNLLILLWALCWNDSYPALVSNDKACFARTVLTTSELLPGILRLWHHPPRAHNRGVRTEAACRAMEDSREHLALTAEFLRGDEAYFVDVLASFLASPKFTRHELSEYVLPAVNSESTAAVQSASIHALELAHALAFRNGLGYSLYADIHATGNITAEDVRDLHMQAANNPNNVAILGTGISTESLAKLFETAFSSHKAPAATPAPSAAPASTTAYHGSTTRVASAHDPQAVFIGFGSTTPALVPALHTLAVHLNPAPVLKWAGSAAPVASAIPAGINARSMLLPYLDATLIDVVLKGKDSAALKEGAKVVVGAFKDTAAGKVGKEELTREITLFTGVWST